MGNEQANQEFIRSCLNVDKQTQSQTISVCTQPSPICEMIYIPETGEVVTINTRSQRLRKKWEAFQHGQSEILSRIMKKNDVDIVDMATDGSVVQTLTELFERRKRRF